MLILNYPSFFAQLGSDEQQNFSLTIHSYLIKKGSEEAKN